MRQLRIFRNSAIWAAAVIFSQMTCHSSCKTFHGIRIPDEIKGKIVSSLQPEVTVKQGTLHGAAELSRNGQVYLSFKGIPFGKVVKRFDIAQPADAWKGTRKATEYGAKCAQTNFFTHEFSGKEDCLTLDVFVPNIETTITRSEKLPVMVYIYGGAFLVGETSTFNPGYFMDEDVIIVTLSYRVGPFGFLNAGVKGASGNQAWKDLVLGLKWVQANIEAFGGNPSKVTIFGESAGGMAVSGLVVSPMAKGLFNAAISQSGVAIPPVSVLPDPEYKEAKKLAHAVDCPTSNLEYMVECLRKVKPELLAKATNLDPNWFERIKTPVVSPTIETYSEGENDPNVFLPENPKTLLKEGRFNKVPFLTGITSHEGLSLNAAGVLLNPNSTKRMNEQWGRIAPQAFFYWTAARDPCVVSGKIKNAYLFGKPVGLETEDALTKIYGDFIFNYPARTIGILHSEHAPVYFYNFTRNVKSSFLDLYGWKHADPLSKPPVHGDDIQFHFSGLDFVQRIDKDSPDYEFSANFVKLWTSFAKNGKPTHVWGSKIQNVDPINTTDTKHSWLTIDNELSVAEESEDFIQRMKLIDDIYKNDFDVPA